MSIGTRKGDVVAKQNKLFRGASVLMSSVGRSQGMTRLVDVPKSLEPEVTGAEPTSLTLDEPHAAPGLSRPPQRLSHYKREGPDSGAVV
ncbi:hypothetical protein ACMYYO_05880 [Dermacoccaceae bacterium W4C1]